MLVVFLASRERPRSSLNRLVCERNHKETPTFCEKSIRNVQKNIIKQRKYIAKMTARVAMVTDGVTIREGDIDVSTPTQHAEDTIPQT